MGIKVKTNAARAAKNLRDLNYIITENAERVIPAAAINFAGNVAEDTPIDTGKALSGWQASKSGPVYESNPTITSPEGVKSAAKQKLGTSAKEAYVSNGVGYIGLLNHGSSQQAPAGFVRSAITRTISNLKGFRVLRKGSAADIEN